MNKGLIKAVLILALAFLLYPLFLSAQDASQTERMRQLLDADKALREKIEREDERPEIEEKVAPKIAVPVGEKKIFIQKIIVSLATLISQDEVNQIISPFENKELTLKDLQKAADLITGAYRQKGYITSRAYLPPQRIEEGAAEIRVLEGITGALGVEGNRFFKTSLFKKRITLKKGEPFNYNILRKNLIRINRRPDRIARAVLIPGEAPGTTDIVLKIEEQLPIHIRFDYDNFGSRYIEEDRYATTLTSNNCFGWDDILSIRYQFAEADTYDLYSLRYLLPLTDDLEVGLYAARSDVDFGKEYKDLNSRGKSKVYNFYLTKNLIEKEDLKLNFGLGFEYKDTFNFILQNEISRDRMRIVKTTLDLDFSDKFGRNVISNAVDIGIPDIMGGLKDKDPKASRGGAGGKFVKDNLSILRLQPMPLNSMLLWKNQFQFSGYTLTASEQFQIGGITTVRGYPPAEYVGDRGYATSLEWSFPPYFIPKKINLPLSKMTLYDTLRIVAFFDWANVHRNNPQAGEEKSETLRAAGFGFRFNLLENFLVRLEFGYPLGDTPSDGDHLHTWLEVSKEF